MVISKEDLQDKTLIVSFKNSAQNKINDLEIYLHCDNIYDIDILGVFKDVDPVKDREKIIIQLTKDAVSELKGIMQNKDSGAK
jgi:hypothetical protein